MSLFNGHSLWQLAFSTILCHLICVESHTHDHTHHHHHDHHEHIDDITHNTGNQVCDETSWTERESLWYGVLSTVFIGTVPILCIKVVSTDDYYLKILLSFASGGLMGDVFLHLLPTALSIYELSSEKDDEAHSGHSHSHNKGYTLLGMHILIGFGIFFVLEKIFHESGSNTSHCDSHSNDESRKHAITVLSICADASHNFTDGLTIAASFLLSFKMGIIQSISILLHEIPHEIGDYAILIDNGVSVHMAMFVQFLTAIGCLIGTILGFILENTQIGTKWIIPFTAGGFIYISCVQVLPTLVEKKYGALQSSLHIVFFGFGVALMLFVGYVEENAQHLFDGHFDL